MRKLFLCVALLLCSGAPRAHASPLLELTGGFGGMGGLQARHTGASAASAYFNPALLPDAPTGVTFGVLVLNTDIGVHVDGRPAGSAVPDISDVSRPGNVKLNSRPIATDLLQNGRAADGTNSALPARPRQHQGTGQQTNTYGAIGLVLNLFHERLALGMYGLIPVTNFMTFQSYYVDEREQYSSNSLHPEMYGDRLTALSFAFAGGARITKTLSIGFGATIGLYASAGAPVYVADASQLTNLDLNINAKAKVSLVPHMGVAWNPGKRWHLSGTLHAPQKLDVKAGFTFLLSTGVQQSSGVAFTYFFQPWQASAGLGYDVYQRGDTTLTVSGLAHYQRWSKYIDRQSTRPDGAYTWMDTVTGTLGARLQQGALGFGLDGQYKPSPVPDQTGRTNYVDNNRLGASFTTEYKFAIAGVDMKLGLQLQLYRLLTRAVRKIVPPTADGVNHTPQLVWDEVPDDAVHSNKQPVAGREGVQSNNPGWPGYKSLGWVSSGGLYLTVFL